jgi:predicted PurR-regulated permease PerM
MSRLVSFVVLVAVILVVAFLFFRVILEFVVPMFLAAVLVVIFSPMHRWFEHRLVGHPRWAAAATTVCIMLIVLVPTLAIGWNAYREIAVLARSAPEAASTLHSQIDNSIGAVIGSLETHFGIHIEDEPKVIRESIQQAIRDWAGEQGRSAALGVLGAALRIVVGVAIMIISLYFFLADGPGMIVTIMHLSPLDDRYELELLNKFSNISRAVVVATLLSAIVQGVLAGIGYYVAGIKVVFALTGLTMLLAVVPFLGAAAVWAPTSAWLLLGDGRPVAATLLALYGLGVVSTIDNVIKPYVLHGQSNLHPLLALLSVLGGVAAMGPIGILVGPMAVAFLQALLGMLRREIDEIAEEEKMPAAVATPAGIVVPEPGSQAALAPPPPRESGFRKRFKRKDKRRKGS